MVEGEFLPLATHIEYDPKEMTARAEAFYGDLRRRRTVGEFAVVPEIRKKPLEEMAAFL